MKDIVAVLENLPIAKGIPYKQLILISSYCEILEYSEDEVIHSQNFISPYIGIILDGKVNYYVHLFKKPIKMGSFKRYPVCLFKFMELKEQNIVIKAAKPTKILAIKYSKLKDLEDEMPIFTMKVYKALLKLSVQINLRLATITSRLVNQK